MIYYIRGSEIICGRSGTTKATLSMHEARRCSSAQPRSCLASRGKGQGQPSPRSCIPNRRQHLPRATRISNLAHAVRCARYGKCEQQGPAPMFAKQQEPLTSARTLLCRGLARRRRCEFLVRTSPKEVRRGSDLSRAHYRPPCTDYVRQTAHALRPPPSNTRRRTHGIAPI